MLEARRFCNNMGSNLRCFGASVKNVVMCSQLSYLISSCSVKTFQWHNFVLDATKYSAGVKLATEYIRAKSFTDLKNTPIPL